MNKNSNAYIIVYSTIMVVIVAALLALASISLSERQNRNIMNEKKGAILSSLGVDIEQVDITSYYNENINALVVDEQGNPIEGDPIALLFDLKTAFEQKTFPVFEYKQGGVVLPLSGSGLWGPIWGYIALEGDMNTVIGVVMDHAGETPGLGAEIATAKHCELYKGKTIFEGNELVAITLRKGGARAENIQHEVDAISGGTKTCDGVSAMFYSSLNNYLGFLTSRIAAQTAAADEAAEVSNQLNTEENE